MKIITINVDYPNSISASDNEGQIMAFTRKPLHGNDPSDLDECAVSSKGIDDVRVIHGTCKWGGAFAAIQDFMNSSTLDQGFNS